MAEEYADEVTPEQKARIIAHYIKSAPPGEVGDILKGAQPWACAAARC